MPEETDSAAFQLPRYFIFLGMFSGRTEAREGLAVVPGTRQRPSRDTVFRMSINSFFSFGQTSIWGVVQVGLQAPDYSKGFVSHVPGGTERIG